MRTGFIIFGILLFIPAIYPAGMFLLFFILFRGQEFTTWLAIAGIILIYFHIFSFMYVLGSDYKKMVAADLAGFNQGYQKMPPQQ